MTEGLKGYDAWKTDAPDPGRLRHPEPTSYRCLDCGWRGTGEIAHHAHFYAHVPPHKIMAKGHELFESCTTEVA